MAFYDFSAKCYKLAYKITHNYITVHEITNVNTWLEIHDLTALSVALFVDVELLSFGSCSIASSVLV